MCVGERLILIIGIITYSFIYLATLIKETVLLIGE